MIKRGQHPILPLIGFTGAAVLAIEVAATRLLAPSFGTTVFAVSGVISVVLGALSLGYYLGGRWADQIGSALLFYGLIFGAGLGTLWIELGMAWLVPNVTVSYGLLLGPLVASLGLFFIPSMLLGSLSPIAVVLYRQQAAHLGVGQAAGSVSFWSTLGSIVGSLATAFVFIPRIGLSWLIFGLGLTLCLIGLTGLALSGLPRRRLLIAGGIVLAMAALVWFFRPGNHVGAIYQKDGRYSRILIYDDDSGGSTVRNLELDGSHSAARFLSSDKLAYPYTQYAQLLSLLRPDARQALVIGGGAYSVPAALVREMPQAQVDVAEIEPDLYRLSQQYFGIKPDPRLHNYVEDGRRILQGKQDAYDVMFGDAYYSTSSIPQHLATQEFFAQARTALRDNGVFMANIIGKLADTHPSFTLSEIKTFRSVFPNSFFVAVNSPNNTTQSQNIMFVGFKGELPDWALALPQNDDQRDIAARSQANTVDLSRFDFSRQPVFTDDFAPIDYYIATSVNLGS